MSLFISCQYPDCPQISKLECKNCGHHSCKSHIGEHLTAHPVVAFQNILRDIQQNEYESLRIEADGYKETLTKRYSQVLEEMKLEAAPYLKKLREIDEKYVRILEDLTLEQTSIESRLQEIKNHMALPVNSPNPFMGRHKPYSSFERVKEYQGHEGKVYGVDFGSHGIVSGGGDRKVKVWDGGELIRCLEGHESDVYCVTSSPQFIASGSCDKTIKLWRARNGELITTFRGHNGLVFSVDISPDEQMLVSSSQDGSAIIWEVSTGRIIKKIEGEASGDLTTAKFSPCGGYVATALGQNFICIWNVGSWDKVKTLEGCEIIKKFAYSPQLIAGGCGDGQKNITLWSVETGAVQNVLRGHSDEIRSIAFSPSYQFIASGSSDRSVIIWSLTECIKVFDGLSGWINSISFSKSGNQLACGDMKGKITIWG